jgi:hypothetical protein
VLNFSWLSDEEDATLRAIASRDWRSDALRLGDSSDEDLAARAVALGAVAGHGFGNVYAVSTHPDPLVTRYVKSFKGLPVDQAGSITTTRAHMVSLFDWSRLPGALSRERVVGLIDSLLERGPFGFRGPAAAHLPAHLTSADGAVRTAQMISPGYRCPSHRFIARCLEAIDENYLYLAEDEPAHVQLRGLQQDFGEAAGVLMLAHPDEQRARMAYRGYLPAAPTILAFHRLRISPDGRPVLRIERHGSLHIDELRPILAEQGFDVELGPQAQERVPVRGHEVLESLLVA